MTLCAVSFMSCSKNEDAAPAPVRYDTLTAGWTKVAAQQANDVFFVNNTGYLVSGRKISRSTNGGATWDSVSRVDDAINIFMTPDGKLFLNTVTGTTTYYKSLNNGANFSIVTGVGPVTDTYFTDNNFGITVGPNAIFRTTDGGASWSQLTMGAYSTLNPLYATVALANNTTGWIANMDRIYKSNGALNDWVPSTINGAATGANYSALSVISSSVVYAAAYGGKLFKSTDGGTTFNLLKTLGTETGFTDIHFLTEQVGYLSCGHYIYKTTDAGVNWTKVASTARLLISEIHFTDASHGWASGEGEDVILKFN